MARSRFLGLLPLIFVIAFSNFVSSRVPSQALNSQGMNISQLESNPFEAIPQTCDSITDNQCLLMCFTKLCTVDHPLVLYNRIQVVSISSIDLLQSEFGLDLFLFQEWTLNQTVCNQYTQMHRMETSVQPLIAIDGAETITSQETLSKVWLPRTYMEELKLPMSTANSYTDGFVHIFPHGDHCQIKYTRRMSAQVNCRMDFREYPNDVQNCSLSMTSYYWSDSVLKYQWSDVPIEFTIDNIDQNHYEMQLNSETRRGIAYDGKNRTWLVVRFIFRRKITHFVYQAVIPSILIVTSSYFSFWITVETGPGRFLFTALPFFALITLYSGVKGQLPPVSYVNASDIWMLATLFFDFWAICGMTYCVYLSREDKAKAAAAAAASARKRQVGRLESSDDGNEVPWKTKPEKKKKVTRSLSRRKTILRHFSFVLYNPDAEKTPYSRADRVDNIMKVLFPILFLTFNTVYWILVLSRRLLS